MSETDTRLNIATAKAAAQWWGDRLQRGDRDAFEKALTVQILIQLETAGGCLLECDYDPQGAVLDAVRAAGVECRGWMFSAKGILPSKHETIIRPGHIEPKEGYANWTAHIEVKLTDPEE